MEQTPDSSEILEEARKRLDNPKVSGNEDAVVAQFKNVVVWQEFVKVLYGS